jgi:ligand-binding SRPBCC domain-containing protein
MFPALQNTYFKIGLFMKNRILTRETIIKRPLAEVFNFFSNAENLHLITPPDLHFKTLTPLPIELKEGTIIDYQLKLYGIHFKWKTKIREWDPPFKFIDEQIKGPYALWIHQHVFFEEGLKTIMHDKVEFLSPGWFLEPMIHSLFVKHNIEKIFDYRQRIIEKILG